MVSVTSIELNEKDQIMSTQNIVLVVLFLIGIALIPGVAIYSNWKIGWDSRRKQRKIADFIEKAADEQIQAKDGPE